MPVSRPARPSLYGPWKRTNHRYGLAPAGTITPLNYPAGAQSRAYVAGARRGSLLRIQPRSPYLTQSPVLALIPSAPSARQPHGARAPPKLPRSPLPKTLRLCASAVNSPYALRTAALASAPLLLTLWVGWKRSNRMAKSKGPGRRSFLKGAAAGAAALVGTPPLTKAQEPAPPARPTALPPTAAQRAAETATATPSIADVQIVEKPGSDFMVDVFKSLGIEYLFATPGSSFRGIHESVINYGGNQNPEFITCTHEECSRRHGQWLRQNRGQAGPGLRPRNGGRPARRHGHLQRILRSGARHRDSRQHHGRRRAPRPRGMAARRAGRGSHCSRLHQVGR